MDLPSRDELTGRWLRKIIYKGQENYVFKPLHDLTWCTLWTGTIALDIENGDLIQHARDIIQHALNIDQRVREFVTVHELTDTMIRNAYAAGYNREDIRASTEFDIENEHKLHVFQSTLITANGDGERGKRKLEHVGNTLTGDKLYAPFYYLKCYEKESTIVEQNRTRVVHTKPSIGKRYVNRQRWENVDASFDDGDVTIDRISRNRYVHSRNPYVQLKYNNATYRICYTYENRAVPINNIWCEEMGIRRLLNLPVQVVIGTSIIKASYLTIHIQKQVFNWESQENLGSSHIVEIKSNNTKEHRTQNKFMECKQNLYKACKEHLVVAPAPLECKEEAMGLGNTFWKCLMNDEDAENDADYQRIQRLKINPYDETKTEPPEYGNIRIDFRKAQEWALEIMFRENKLRSGIYILPCGGGKTLLGIAAAVRSGKRRVLVLVPNETIMHQWIRRFQERALIKCYQIEENIPLRRRTVVVAKWDKLKYGLNEDKNKRKNEDGIKNVTDIFKMNWDLLIMDEAHNIRTADQTRQLMQILSYKIFIGLTATANTSVDEEKEDGKKPSFPWHVEFAPVVYETAWPIKNTIVKKIPCASPVVFEKSERNESKQYDATESVDSLPVEVKKTNEGNMKNSDICIYNVKKIIEIEKLINWHEKQGEPIIVFVYYVAHVKMLRRTLVREPVHYSHRLFGKFLKLSADKYVDRIKMKYAIAAKINNMTQQPHELTDEMKLLCPYLDRDNYWEDYKNTMQEEIDSNVWDIIKRVTKKDKDQIESIDGVTSAQYEKLFFLLDTPRVAMHGQTDPYNMKSRTLVYEKFKRGHIKTLIVNSITDEGVDLPNARVVIITGGAFGKRTQTAQRFGRALRGVEDSDVPRYLYEVYTGGKSIEEKYVDKRLEFLEARGYTIEEMKSDSDMDVADSDMDVGESDSDVGESDSDMDMDDSDRNEIVAGETKNCTYTLETTLGGDDGYTRVKEYIITHEQMEEFEEKKLRTLNGGEQLEIRGNEIIYRRLCSNLYDNNRMLALLIAEHLGKNVEEIQYNTSVF